MIVIFILSSRESVSVSDTWSVNFVIFKTLHVIEYFILYVLWYRVTRSPISSFLLTIAYAAGDELHQTFVPTREGKLRDVIIDSFGAVLAWISLTQLRQQAPRKLRDWAKRWQLM
jgi:VanZ family protein